MTQTNWTAKVAQTQHKHLRSRLFLCWLYVKPRIGSFPPKKLNGFSFSSKRHNPLFKIRLDWALFSLPMYRYWFSSLAAIHKSNRQLLPTLLHFVLTNRSWWMQQNNTRNINRDWILKPPNWTYHGSKITNNHFWGIFSGCETFSSIRIIGQASSTQGLKGWFPSSNTPDLNELLTDLYKPQ